MQTIVAFEKLVVTFYLFRKAIIIDGLRIKLYLNTLSTAQLLIGLSVFDNYGFTTVR